MLRSDAPFSDELGAAEPTEEKVDVKKSTKFKRLIDEVIAGGLQRSRFELWEIDVLLDIQSQLTGSPSKQQQILRGYQEAAYRQMEEDSDVPLRITDYVNSLKPTRQHKRARRAANRPGSR